MSPGQWWLGAELQRGHSDAVLLLHLSIDQTEGNCPLESGIYSCNAVHAMEWSEMLDLSLSVRDQAEESKYLKMLGSSVILSSFNTQHYQKNTCWKMKRSGSWKGEKVFRLKSF